MQVIGWVRKILGYVVNSLVEHRYRTYFPLTNNIFVSGGIEAHLLHLQL